MDPYCFLLNAMEAATGLVGFCLSGEELTTGKLDLGWYEVTLNFCTCKNHFFLQLCLPSPGRTSWGTQPTGPWLGQPWPCWAKGLRHCASGTGAASLPWRPLPSSSGRLPPPPARRPTRLSSSSLAGRPRSRTGGRGRQRPGSSSNSRSCAPPNGACSSRRSSTSRTRRRPR